MARLSLMLAVVSVFALALPESVAAHCPGTYGRWYAEGHRTVSPSITRVRADIEYTSKSICGLPPGDGWSFEAVGLQPSSGSLGWVQVGWERRQNGSLNLVCEWQRPDGTGWGQYKEAVTAATHNYSWEYNSGTASWYCRRDNYLKKSVTGLGFTSGKFLLTQGETNSFHSQLGRVDPGRLYYRNLGMYHDGFWATWSPNAFSVNNPPYHASSSVGQFWDWTNASH